MPRASLWGGEITVEVEYHEQKALELVPGMRYVHKQKRFLAPLSLSTCYALRSVYPNLEVDPELNLWAYHEHQKMEERLNAKHPGSIPVGERWPKLYPFQQIGAHFLRVAQHAILGDDMGVGKTIQAIHATDAYPVLVVCPNSLKKNWKKEWERWSGFDSAVVIGGTPTQRRKQLAENHEVYIINYEAVRLHSRLAPFGSIRLSEKDKENKELNEMEFGTVIADEAHRMTNVKADMTRAVWAVAHGPTVKQRFALTGTPVRNDPLDFWSLLHFISPVEWPSRTRYRTRYVNEGVNFHGYPTILGINPATQDEFNRLVDHRFLRRTKEEVLPDLPPKIYQTRYVDMEPKQAKAYKALQKEMIVQLDSGILVAADSLSLTTRLRQAATATIDFIDSTVELSAPSNKVSSLLDIIDERAGKPVVVFAEHKRLIDLCAAELAKRDIPFGRITSDESPDDRSDAAEAFQRGQLLVILCTLGAGGEGWTLTASDCVVFLQRSWASIPNTQGEDRIHRIGQEAKSVEIIDIVSSGTIESSVVERYGHKQEMMEEVVRDRDRLRELLDDV